MIEKIKMSAFTAYEKVMASHCISKPAYTCRIGMSAKLEICTTELELLRIGKPEIIIIAYILHIKSLHASGGIP